MSLSRYQAYRDTGVGAAREVPAHWDLPPLYLRYEVLLGKMLDAGRITGEHPVPYLRNVDVQWGQINYESLPLMDIAPNEIDRYSIREGDVLVCEGGEVGRSAVVESFIAPIGFQKALHRLRPIRESEVSRYILYALRWAAESGAFANNGHSTIAHLTGEQLRKHRLPRPTASEQRAIVTFLDRETAKIDALIAEQEKLIALLAEKRQATISHAVTKGLNPDAPMKDSGVPWLGEVPAHWEVDTLGRVTASRCDGPFGSGIKSEHYTDTGALVVRLQNIKAGVFNKGESVFLDESYFKNELQTHDVRSHDVLVAGLGDENNLLGRACVAPSDLGLALVKADCFRFRLRLERADPDFVAWQLSASAAFDAGVLATGTTRSRIPLGTMARRRLALPPKAEQRDIARHISLKNERVDGLRIQSEHAVRLLRERRSALVAAAVTGQVDVREAA